MYQLLYKHSQIIVNIPQSFWDFTTEVAHPHVLRKASPHKKAIKCSVRIPHTIILTLFLIPSLQATPDTKQLAKWHTCTWCLALDKQETDLVFQSFYFLLQAFQLHFLPCYCFLFFRQFSLNIVFLGRYAGVKFLQHCFKCMHWKGIDIFYLLTLSPHYQKHFWFSPTNSAFSYFITLEKAF